MKGPSEIIDQLSASEARSILKALGAGDKGLGIQIADMALSYLSGVDVEQVAVFLYEELDTLEVEEAWDRSGQTRHGYVDPSEAADQMIEEVLEPCLADLAKYQKLGMNMEANRVCMGLLQGFCRFEEESKAEFKNWAPDAASNFAWVVVDAWKKGAPSKADRKALKAFIEEEMAGWGAHLV